MSQTEPHSDQSERVCCQYCRDLEKRVAALEEAHRREAASAAEATAKLRELFPDMERRQW